MANTIRVYKTGGKWLAKRDGASKGRYFATQREAYLYARDVALNKSITITVYYPTGGIKAVINPRNREEESNCFITTACVKYYGLKDDCYELQTLRHFRDTYLLKSDQGKQMVNKYYEVAPAIVKSLEADNEKKIIFADIFLQIKSACSAIEHQDFEKATNIYKSTVANLYHKFNKG